MKFRKLTIENYKSFQFATEIRFPVGAKLAQMRDGTQSKCFRIRDLHCHSLWQRISMVQMRR